jgi:hypothetical protein
MFVVSLRAMNAEGDEDFDVFISDSPAIQAVYEQREIEFTAGIAGNVGGNDHHLLTGPDGGNSGVTEVQRGFDYFRGGLAGDCRLRSEHSREMLRREVECKSG